MSFRDALVQLGVLKSASAKARDEVPLGRIVGARGRSRLRGRARSLETPLVAPFTGRHAVFWAVEHREQGTVRKQTSRGSEIEIAVWRQQFRSGAMTSFEIVDDDGARARVVLPPLALEADTRDPVLETLSDGPLREQVLELRASRTLNATWIELPRSRIAVASGGVSVELDVSRVTDAPRLNELPPDLDAFFRARGVAATRYMGLVREHELDEARIEVGAMVEVIGDASLGRDALGDGYRGGGSLVMLAPEFVLASIEA
jgi:hypothetical protein